jgi:hypothetical protein
MNRPEYLSELRVWRVGAPSLVVLSTAVASGMSAAMTSTMGVTAATEGFASAETVSASETVTATKAVAAVRAFAAAEHTAGVAAAEALLRMSSTEKMKSVRLA